MDFAATCCHLVSKGLPGWLGQRVPERRGQAEGCGGTTSQSMAMRELRLPHTHPTMAQGGLGARTRFPDPVRRNPFSC